MLSDSNLAGRLNISTFGGLSICMGDEPVVGFASRKAEALLVYLAVTAREQPREALADLLWDDRSQERAASNLRTVLASLRKCLGDFVQITRHSAAVCQNPDVWVDALELERTILGIHDRGGVFWPSEARKLAQSLELYKSDFLQGFNIRGCRDFENWMLVEREHLYQLELSGLEGLVDYFSERGEYQAGIAHAQRWAQLNPIMETAHQKLMRLLVYAGRSAQALAQFEACAQILDEELGLEPSTETKELCEQIKRGGVAVPEAKPVREPVFMVQPPKFLDPNTPERASFPVFVARRRQLEYLQGCLASAVSGNGQVVFVTGGPGRGKTALLSKFAHRAMSADPDLLVAVGRCNAYEGAGDTYLPFLETLGMLSGDVEQSWEAGSISSDHARRLWAAAPLTASALLEHGPNLIDTFLSAEELLARVEISAGLSTDTSSSFPPTSQQVPRLRRAILSQRAASTAIEQSFLFEQYMNVLAAIAREKPLLLVLDDLQWADSSSIALLFHLVRRLKGSRIMIAAAYRPDEVALGREGGRHPLEKILSEIKLKHGDVWLDLADIDQEESWGFVNELIDSEPNKLGQNFREALFQHTGGYALFTVELLHSLQESGCLLKDEEGRWVVSTELDWEQLPVRVEAVIEERIGRLDPDIHDILSIASVEGEEFTAQVVGYIQHLDERYLLRTLSSELEKRHRLVHGQGSVKLNGRVLSTYRFSHALFQSYLYNELDEAERFLLHHQTGEALEELYGERSDMVAEQLAFHFRGDSERECHYTKIAGEKAAARYANAEALRYFSRALELTPEEDFQERYDLLLQREDIYHLQGERSVQQDDLTVLAELAQSLGNDQKKIEVLLRQARLVGKTKNNKIRLDYAQEALRLAETTQDVHAQAEAYMHLGFSFRVSGDKKSAAEILQHSLELARVSNHKQVEAKVLRLFGDVSNEIENDTQYLQQALEIYQQLGDLAGEAKVLNNLGCRACYVTQDFAKARDYFNRGLVICRKIGFLDGELWLVHNQSALDTYVGNYEAAWANIQLGLEIAREINFDYGKAMIFSSLGRFHIELGAYPKAVESFKQSLELALEIGGKQLEIESLCSLSLINQRVGKQKTALKYVQKAMLLAGEIDDYYMMCGMNLGLVYEGLGDLEKSSNGFKMGEKRALELSLPLFVAESRAGLARLALSSGDLRQAQFYINQVLDFMDSKLLEVSAYEDEDLAAASPFDGVDEPFLIYLTLFRVLDALGDIRADKILDSAYNLLMARAKNIHDENLRRSYLENVPHHREIVQAWTTNLKK